MKAALTTALLAAPAAAHATFSVREGNGHDYTVTDVKSGAMTVDSVSMVPPHKWDTWKAGSLGIVTVEGTTTKKIEAGTFKWQMYETGVKSFIASGNAPFFQCDNKGCDPAAPVALKWKKGTSGDFTLQLSAALPEAKGTSKDFKLVLWAEDQDHEPYDFSATINFKYSAAQNTFSSSVSNDSGVKSLKAAQLTVHHADNGLGSGGDAHCSEITIQDPSSNEYWAAHSYQYPSALWPRGGCDRKKYNYFNRKKEIAKGVSMTTLGIHKKHDNAAAQAEFYAAAVKALEETSNTAEDSVKKMFLRGVKAKLGLQEAANSATDDWSTIYMITNPSSPMGKQHCQELDNPGGKSSKYWASKGWKYTSPPWKPGKCDRNRFNYVNREMQNLDGFDGVTFWYLGIQV